ncbi:GIY-YIG nuclease family protein [Virgibacillus flavescens]|uniref:GIY-YIG nuclease family protein n=1 Tax=Virgibacillus flavescens TaxID=1611422 RepID=UPI003D341002
MEENNHVVYILKCKDSTLYTGYTNNLAKRLRMHQSGKGAKYTRGRGPFQVEFVERFSTKEEALKQEYAIKKLKRSAKEHLISLNKLEVVPNENTKKL